MRGLLCAVGTGIVASAVSAGGAAAQTATGGPRWERQTADDLQARPIRGAVLLRVTSDPVAGRPASVTFAVRVTRGGGAPLRCDRLPTTLRWDTAGVPDGWNWLELVMTDATTGREAVIDSLRVYVANRDPSLKGLPTPPTPPVVLSAPVPAPDAVRAPVTVSRGGGGRRSGRRQTAALTLPDKAEPTRVEATVTDSAAPLSAPATALCRAGDRLYLGLPDGGVAFCDTDGGKGRAVRLLAGTGGPVRALAADRDAVYWLCSGADRLYCYRDRDRTVTAWDLTSGDSPWVERIAVLGGRVALLGDGEGRLLDPKTGTLAPLTDALPAAVMGEGARVFVAAGEGDRDVALLSVTGPSVRVWTAGRPSSNERDWQDRGEVNGAGGDFSFGDAHSSGRVSAAVPVALTPYGFAVFDGRAGDPVRVGLAKPAPGHGAFEPADLTTVVDDNPNAPQRPRRVALGGSGVWWEENGIVQRTDPYTGRRDAYLPWNGAGADVRALLADRDGVWVATDKGVRRIVPARPTDADGFGGYVRLALGPDAAAPQSDRDRKVAALVEEWQGVPYKWGGQTKQGADCSGFVCSVHRALGVSLPRSSSEMGKPGAGRIVRDELRYGDVLVFPGHVALYIGNGRTAETVGGTPTGSVGKASVWRRRDVTVKRFWP